MSISLYLLHTQYLKNQEMFEARLKKVNEIRRRKVLALKSKEEQCRSLAAGVLLEHILALEGYSADLLRFPPQGRPFLEGVEDFWFNLSHSGEYAACVAGNHPAGVDIQIIEKNKTVPLGRFLRPEEMAVMEGAKEEERNKLFFRFWTARESYGKLTGRGVFREMNSCRVDLEAGILTDLCNEKRSEQKIYLKEYGCLTGYSITVCSYENAFVPLVRKIFYRL
ncbi:MAG: 4'-phosphopantetheinyl transferase superfamily protein [Lachnospiraceae bacterium]|nr:4'-phosphopantetheinyl transferase superfamily protein [Lachnospiraceae bacterium]